jgi:hypothetical protein
MLVAGDDIHSDQSTNPKRYSFLKKDEIFVTECRGRSIINSLRKEK